MRKLLLIAIFSGLFFTQQALADNMDNMEGKPCMVVAKACKAAGFKDHKEFWMQCMKPIILGQTVKDVKVDAADVKACRDNKIERMKKELTELESVKS